MKYLPLKLLLGLVLAAAIVSPAFGQGRIATIDLRKTFDAYWKTKEADASIKDRAGDMEKEYKNMLGDFQKAKEEFDKLAASASDQAVSQDERDKRKKLAEDKMKYLRDQDDVIKQYRQQATTTLDEQKRRMRDNIVGEIRTIVNGRAKAASYTLVIDVSAESLSNAPVILFSNGENDITASVIEELNKTAPAGTPKPDEKKTDEKKAGEKKAGEKKAGEKK
jgi:Skp family chaperone for outer membrane proteins